MMAKRYAHNSPGQRTRLAVWLVWLGLGWLGLSGATPVAAQSLPGLPVLSNDVSLAPTEASADSGLAADSIEIQLQPLNENDSPPVITALAASHDGRFIAAAGDDHAIRVIDVVGGTTFSTLSGHTDWIQSLVFSSDSQQLYSAGNDGRVLKWNHRYPVSYEELLRLDFAVRSMSLATQKNLLAIAGFSDQVVVWDLAADAIKHQLVCNSSDQRCIRFSPDGMYLLCGGRSGVIDVWDTQTGSQLANYAAHTRRVFTAAFASDGSAITSVGEDRRMVRYDLRARQVTLSQEVAPAKLMSMCLINDGMVAVAGADNSIHLVDVLAGEFVAHLKGHSGTVAVMCACGDYLASGSFDTTVRVWDLPRIAERRVDYGKPVSAPLKMDAGLQIR